jgi:two-component system sensor histidine kinase/response regulator
VHPASATAEVEPTELPQIPGLDTNDGLTRVAGNRKLYSKLLGQFVEQQGSALRDLSAALERGDTATAERLAHTLKGVAGNLGAKSLQAAAGQLEKLIRGRADKTAIESAKREVAAVLDPLLAQLAQSLNSQTAKVPDQPTAAVEPAQSRDAAAQLTALLSQFDPGSVDFVEANRATLRPLFAGEAWAPFEKLVQDYSFAEAQAQLEQALTRF